ncbi:hypothetical protein [Paracandidimonas lactea]|uniref:hypothetical protein n=1 Tax=Paracandidimonas lactea TaxID=2895524 RepID=UPI001F1A9306|nr:hypothetical protein [Paracandidimonas lactea]
MTIIRKLIRTDGTEIHLEGPHALDDVKLMIGADTLEPVMLRHLGNPLHVMLIDDAGYLNDLPINQKATELYWENCRPGTTHAIRGDVVIVPDGDYAEIAS